MDTDKTGRSTAHEFENASDSGANIPDAIQPDGSFCCPDKLIKHCEAIDLQFQSGYSVAISKHLHQTLLAILGALQIAPLHANTAGLIDLFDDRRNRDNDSISELTCNTMRALIGVGETKSVYKTFRIINNDERQYLNHYSTVLHELCAFHKCVLAKKKVSGTNQAAAKELETDIDRLRKENDNLRQANQRLSSKKFVPSPNGSHRTCTYSPNSEHTSWSGSKKTPQSSKSKKSPGSSGQMKKRASQQKPGSNKKTRRDGPPKDPPNP